MAGSLKRSKDGNSTTGVTQAQFSEALQTNPALKAVFLDGLS